MKIVIPGGTGQVGTVLAREYVKRGHEVVLLSRHQNLTSPFRTVLWDAIDFGPWTRELDDADVVINLAGRSVNCRYNEENRRAIMDSRVNSTRILGAAIGKALRPPRLWLQSSTATVYAHRYDAPNDEEHGIIGGSEPGIPDTWKFSIEVALAWEKAFNEAPTPRTRRVAMRSAMVMSPDRGGIFDMLLTLVRRGLGGTSGDGRQFVSWVHERDFVRALDWLMEHDDVAGPVNICSPKPLPNADFMRELREAWGQTGGKWGSKVGLPASKWMLEVGAVVLRTETELILKSRRVVPGRLLAGGFAFEQAEWRKAARELCGRVKGEQ